MFVQDFPKMKSATTAQETLNQIYSNRNLSSVYSIPRKQAGPGCCLEEVKVHGREWREVTKIVQQSVMDRRTMARWRIDRVQLCTNTTLEERFIRRRQKMKEDGRSAKELTEHYAFYVVSHGKARHVCQSGLWASFGQTAFANILGRSDMGVYVRRNADIALKLAEKCNFTVTALMVFKIIPGRIKSIPTSFTPIEDAIEPTPNFDSHVSNRLPTAVQKEAHQLANSCIYLYEYDESCRPSKAPSQILPYAVVSCTQISKPKVLLASPVVSLTDVSSSDTDGRGSDMDIVDDSADEKESPASSVSIEAVKGKQASEGNKKLSVEDIQSCNLGPSSRPETGVFLKPAPLPRENKISPTKNHGANSATSQGTSGTTLLKPATFQYGKKELQTNDKRTVSSSNSSSTSSQRYQDMAAGFFAKLKDPRIRSGQRSNELHVSCSSMRGSSKSKTESRPESPQKSTKCRLDAKTMVRQAEHSSHVLGGNTASKQKEEMQVGHCSKPVLPKCNMSSKSRAVDSSASKHMGSIKKRKPSAKLKEKIRRFLADEIEVTREIKKTTAGIQKRKKPEEKVKETKTHRIQKDARDGTLSTFERQLNKSRHADGSKQHASVSNTARQHNKEDKKKQSDKTVREPVGGKANDSNPSDSEHTEMLSVLQSLDKTLDLLTPSTVTLSSSEMSDSASEATALCRAPKASETEFLKTEDNNSAFAGQEEESMCLETMEIPEQTISEVASIGYYWDNTGSAGSMSLKEGSSVGSVQSKVVMKEEDRIQETDTNMEKESTIWLQALGIEKLPEDAFPTKTVKQEAVDASDPICPNSGDEVYSSQEKMMEPKKTCEKEENGGTSASMLVIDQVFSLAYTEKAQEESAIPGDTAVSFPYHLAKQGTITDTSLPPSQIIDSQALDLPVSDTRRNLDRVADHLETNTTRDFLRTTSDGVADLQTRRTSMCEDTGRATLEQRGGTADVRGEQDCQPSCKSQCYASRCTWQTKEDTVLESLLTGALNTLELGVQKLQSNSDCPQLVVAVRTAVTIATRTSTTLLELAVQEVRDHISRKAGQTVEEMFQPPPLDCRKLESLISGTINTLKMTSDDIDGTCSLQTSFRTALTLLELALDILWMRNQSGANTVGQPQLCPQADNMASEARHPMEHQSNVFTGQWEESGAQSQTSQWHNNNMVTDDQEKFSMEKEEECGSRHRQLITAGTNDASKSAKPVTPPPLPPPLPNFLFFPPQQLFTATRRQVNSLSVPSPDELGADHNGNLVGMLAKCGDSREPEGAMNRNKQTTKSLQTEAICREMQTTTKLEGTRDDEEITPNLSVKPQKIMVDYDMKSHAQVDPLAGAEKSHMWTDEGAKKIARFEDPTATTCDQPMPMVTSGTEQDGGLTGKEGMSSLQTKATFPSKDNRAMSGFSVLKENDCMQPHSCDPEKLTIKEETDSSLDHQQVCVKTCADNSSTSPEQRCKTKELYAEPCNTEEEKHVHGTQKSEERKEKVEEESHDHENHEEKRPGRDVPSQPCVSQESVLSHVADDDMLADDVPLHADDDDDHHHEFFSISNDSSSLSSSIMSLGGQSLTSLSSHDSLLWSKEAVVENTASEVATRPFSCFASPSKEEPTDEGSRNNCSSSAKLAATANIDPALGNKLALAAELSTKLSCPKMLINEPSTTSPVREKTTQEDGRQKEKDAYERARRQWRRLFKSFVDHQKANNKASGEVKVEEHFQKSPQIDSCSAPVHGSKVETKTELKEPKTSGCPEAGGSHKACNSPVLCEAKVGLSPTNCCKDSDSPLCLCKSELYKTSSMKRPQDKALGDEELILQKQEKSASPKSSDVVPLYNAIHMSQDSKLYDAPFDFDMVLSCARSCHAQEMLQCVTDRMKKVSAEMEHFQQGIMQLELDKSSFDGLYLQKDQHMLLLRSAVIHLTEISTEFEMLQATETYLSNIRRKEMGHKEKKNPLRDVASIMPEEDFAPPEERKPDTIRNILLRQLDMKKGQVKALHKSLKSYQSINGNNFEFVRMLLRSQIHTCGTDIQRLEEKLREENPSVKIDCNEAKISLVQERQTKCQDLLKVLVKDSSQDYAKIEWCKMKSRRYHGILLYEGDKCYLRERRTRSKSSPSAADDKTKGLVSRESSRAKTKNSSSSKTIKRQHDAAGKQPHGKNDPSRKRRKTSETIQQTLGDEEMSSKGHMNPTADDAATVETRAGCLSATSQEKSVKREKSSCLQNCRDRPEQKRPKLLVPNGNGHETQQQSPAASRLPSPCDLHQKLLRDRESLISSKSLPVVVTPAASGQAEDVSGHSSNAGQDIFGKLTGTTKSALSAKCPLDSKCAMKAKTADASGHSSKASQNIIGKPTGSTKSDATKKEAVSVAGVVPSCIRTVKDPSPQEPTTLSGIKGIGAKGPLDSEGAVKAKTTAVTKPIQTCLTNRTFHSPSRKASVSGIHSTSSTVNKQPFISHSPSRKAAVPRTNSTSSTANMQPLIPHCPNMYSAVPYTYPAQNTPPHHVQYPTSHLRPRMNWWSQGPNVLHRPMFPPQPLFPFPNQQMFPNRWPTK